MNLEDLDSTHLDELLRQLDDELAKAREKLARIAAARAVVVTAFEMQKEQGNGPGGHPIH